MYLFISSFTCLVVMCYYMRLLSLVVRFYISYLVFLLILIIYSILLSFHYLLLFVYFIFVFFFKQKTAYEMRISDWSSDVCSSDLHQALWQRYGNHHLSLHEGSEIRDHVGSDAYAAILIDRSGGHIHPLNLALGEATALESLGGVIHEDSTVLALERGEPVRVRTAHGVVNARFAIVACNAYIGALTPPPARSAALSVGKGGVQQCRS